MNKQSPESISPANTAHATKAHTVGAMPAPIAKKLPVELNLHGVKRVDNYFWLRDDERKAPEVISHLEAENRYTASQFSPFKELQEELFKELVARIDKDESSVPYQWHSHWYSRRYQAGFEYPFISRHAGPSSSAETLLDVNKRAVGHEFYGLGGVSVSPDETMLAFGEDTLSRRIYTIYFKSLTNILPTTKLPTAQVSAPEALLEDTLTGTDGRVVWSNDNQYVYYIKKDLETLLGNKVYRHKLGTAQSQDKLMYEEKDETFYISLSKSLDESRIMLFHESTVTSEVSVLDANETNPEKANFKPLLARETDHEYSIDKRGDEYYIVTNWQAENFRLMKVAQKDFADKSQWQEVIAADEQVRIEDILLLQDHLIVQSRSNGITNMEVHPFNGDAPYQLDFDDPAYVVGFDVNASQNTTSLRLYYSSLTTPESIFEYSLNQPNQKRLLKQEKILGGFNVADYQSERIFVDARDGEKVPVSLVYRTDKFAKDGTNPMYQYGYGAYGHVVEPGFDSSNLSLLDRGFVVAIAHVRGSEMLGRPWYDDGRMLNKQHSFDDFVDVTQALVEQKYAASDKVVAVGRSAGGLLMGGVVNQAPERYFAVAAGVPFVDIVTTMLDASIPLTTNEYDEWGNPNEKQYFDYMLSYSPYDQVSKQAYPHMLVTTGLHDSQVQYFEPAKWVAKLRDYKTDNNLLLLDTDMEAGHGGKSGRYQAYQDTAQEFAFFIGLLGQQSD